MQIKPSQFFGSWNLAIESNSRTLRLNLKMTTSPLPVLLGVADTECQEHGNWNLNKIGGLPDWMNCPQSKVHHHPVCKLCTNPLYLVVQIYCPLSGSPYHRTLYVFACAEKACQQNEKSWSVLRMQKLEEKNKINNTSEKLNSTDGVGDWTDDADDWGSDGDDDDDNHGEGDEAILQSISEPQKKTISNNQDAGSALADSLSELKNLSLSETTESWIPANDSRNFIPHYMNVFNEPEEEKMAIGECEQRLLSEYAEREGFSLATHWDLALSSTSADDKDSSEVYEKTLPSHGSSAFLKFSKRIRRCPEQCLRYCWSGKPLLIADFPDGFCGPPVCQFCGATRVFEFQVMSPLISVLHCSYHPDASLDFGTLLIYSCSRSCWESGSFVREECAILQKDPDHDVIGHL